MTINFSANILQSLIWMLITYFWVRYIQDILYIERQYNYLNRLENKINNLTDGQMFNREGKHYLYKYPIVLNLIDLFYKMIIPILFFAINTGHILKEYQDTLFWGFSIYDTLIYLVLFVLTWFYFFEIHRGVSAWFKRCRIINSMSKKLHQLLYYV